MKSNNVVIEKKVLIKDFSELVGGIEGNDTSIQL